MRRSRRPIIIASRRSQLARVQAELVGAALKRLHPAVEISYVWIESEGDQFLEASLADSGGKGLFAKAIEQALLDHRADLAVHSLKDLPTKPTKRLVVAAVPPREDVRDCLVTRHAAARIDDLPQGAVFGTASPRRAAQVLRLRPDLKIELIRGNVQTRLRKVLETPAESSEPESNPPLPPRPDRRTAASAAKPPAANPQPPVPHYDATLMAVAGLTRAGLARHADRPVDPSIILPAAGQGALALQCRGDDHITMQRVLPLNHAPTAQAVELERAIIDGLAGDCHSPIAAYAEPILVDGRGGYRLTARVISPDGRQMIEAKMEAGAKELRHLASRVLERLEEQGARQVLARE